MEYISRSSIRLFLPTNCGVFEVRRLLSLVSENLVGGSVEVGSDLVLKFRTNRDLLSLILKSVHPGSSSALNFRHSE